MAGVSRRLPAAALALGAMLLLAQCEGALLKDYIIQISTAYEWQAGPRFDAGGDALAGAGFGFALAVSGEWAVVGAKDESLASGAVYFLKLESGDWTNKQRFVLSDPDSDALDLFGFSVGISVTGLEGYAIVGAPGWDGATEAVVDGGAAYIYKLSSGTWSFLKRLDPGAGEPDGGDQMGMSVAICGDYAVVGAPYDDVIQTDRGAAFLYYRDSDNWTLQAVVRASDAQNSDQLGWAAALTPDYAVVGAPYADVGATTDAGKAYLFARSGVAWGTSNYENWILAAETPAASGMFGNAVGIAGLAALVGAPGSNGAAFVFEKGATSWDRTVLPVSGQNPGDRFGTSVAIDGDSLLVGAPEDDTLASNAGAAFLFERTDSGWVQRLKLTDGAGAADDQFGSAVAVSGTHALVGAMGDDGADTNSGSGFPFERTRVQ
jgi:hypothetical protein